MAWGVRGVVVGVWGVRYSDGWVGGCERVAGSDGREAFERKKCERRVYKASA